MRTIIAAGLVALLVSFFSISAAQAQGSTATVEDTISSQINAFKADNFDEAFSYASPTIQMLFGDANRFGMMVRNGYPMVWRPADVRFLEAEAHGEGQRQKVLIRDQGGQVHVLEYFMIQGDAGWLIDGVTKLPSPDVSA